MKKITLIGFAMFFAFSLTACGTQNISQEKENVKNELKEDLVKKTNDLSLNKEEKNEKNPSEEDKKVEEKDIVEKGDTQKKKPVVVPQQTLLILDASGSMWGQIDGRAKIDIAKEVVKKTVKNFENTDLGLMAYGHRRKGDCSDIEILATPQKNNAENIAKMVDGISPKGMTPMGASVLMAAESLKYTEQKATIILVSDGIETCDVDLCELGKKLEEAGVDFTAHVIGFDMTEEQTIGLKCLANETGGTFTSAKNADDLGKALEETVEAASCSREKLGEAVITSPETIAAGSDFEIETTGPKNEKDFVALVPKDSTDSNDHLSYFYPKSDDYILTAPVEAGEYDIVYFADCGADLGRRSIVVTEVSANIVAPKTVAAGSDFTVEVDGPKNDVDFVAIVSSGSVEANDHLSYFYPKSDDYILTAPAEPGGYDIVYFADREKVLSRVSLSVTAVSANIIAPKTIAAGLDFKVELVGPKNDVDFVALITKNSTDPNDHLSYFYPKNDDYILTAPAEPGEYDIVYFVDDKVLTRVTIEVTEVSASLSGVPENIIKGESFEITWTGPNNDGNAITILPKGSNNWNDHVGGSLYSMRGDKKSGKMTAPAELGEYDVVYWLNSDKILDRKHILVTN